MPAMAVGQSTSMLKRRTSSLASQLPQGFVSDRDDGCAPIIVGVSLLAMAVGQSMAMLSGPASSRAGSLLQGLCTPPNFNEHHKTLWELACQR